MQGESDPRTRRAAPSDYDCSDTHQEEQAKYESLQRSLELEDWEPSPGQDGKNNMFA